MKGMLKAELFKFSHACSLWIIIGVLVGCCGISIATGTYDSAESTLASISKDSMVPILACAIYSAIMITDDFSNGLVRQYVSNGYTRTAVISAKLIHYLFGCTVLLLIYPMISTLAAAIVQGIETTIADLLQAIIVSFIRTLPLYLGLFSVFYLFSVLLKKGVFAMGVSVAFAILMVVFTNKFYENAPEILKYSPVIQINEISGGNITTNYLVSVILSLILLILCAVASVLKFNHDEL